MQAFALAGKCPGFGAKGFSEAVFLENRAAGWWSPASPNTPNPAPAFLRKSRRLVHFIVFKSSGLQQGIDHPTLLYIDKFVLGNHCLGQILNSM